MVKWNTCLGEMHVGHDKFILEGICTEVRRGKRERQVKQSEDRLGGGLQSHMIKDGAIMLDKVQNKNYTSMNRYRTCGNVSGDLQTMQNTLVAFNPTTQ